MKIGIRAHDLIKGNPEQVFDQAIEYGFDSIQLVFKKALLNEDGNPLVFNKENALKISDILKTKKLNIAMLGAYFNPVHSNKSLKEDNINYFKEHLKFASLLNCKYVGTETGSYNDDKWTYNPKNQTEEGYQETMSVFKDLVKTAEKYNTTILMEPAWGHVIYSVEQLKRAYDEINSDNLKVTIDIFNLLYIGNYKNYKEIFLKALKTFGNNIKVFHLKDFYVENDKIIQCGLGEGFIDFEFIINSVSKYSPDATLVFEGVVGKDIKNSYLLINKLLEKTFF